MRPTTAILGVFMLLTLMGSSCHSSLVVDNPPLRRYIIHNNLDEAVIIYGYDYQAKRWLIATIKPDSAYVDAERGAYEAVPPPFGRKSHDSLDLETVKFGCIRFYRDYGGPFANGEALLNAANYEGYDDSIEPLEQQENTSYTITASTMQEGRSCR